MEQKYFFTIDDNIRFLEDLTKGEYDGIFSHPYANLLKRLHERFGTKVQLNLFYEKENFNLSQMTDKYADEWRECSDWLKLSFHSQLENVRPYKDSPYREVYDDCARVHKEILRFAGESSLAKTTTVHYCLATEEGLSALFDNGVRGLLGLYGTADAPRSSYCSDENECKKIRAGESVLSSGIYFAGIDIVLNLYSSEQILSLLDGLKVREEIKVMIHEQYFYEDYFNYQPDFEEKLTKTFEFFDKKGIKSAFFEECIDC